MIGDVILYGDPHGEWEPLLRACADEPPVAVILLGDCDLEKPLREQLQPVFENGISVFWIPGNHDCDSEERYDRLFGDYPAGNIHANAVQIDKMRVAGLGGVFKARIWHPRSEATKPMHPSRKSFLRTVPRAERWRGGLPLAAIDAIFPEDVEALGRTRADFLVTHESPAATSTVSSASTWRPPPAAPDSSSTAIITRATRRALGASAFWSADSERQRFLGSA